MVLILLLARAAQAGSALPHEITKSIQLHSGTYLISQPLAVTGSNLVVDGNGAMLVGVPTLAFGVHVVKGQNVTIKNLRVKGCRWGIEAEGTSGLRLLAVDVSENQATASAAIGEAPTEFSGRADPDSGGGIYLRGVTGGTLEAVTAGGDWSGVTLSRCAHVVLNRCALSRNLGAGVVLWNSSDNEVRDSEMSYIAAGNGEAAAAARKLTTPAGVVLEHHSDRNRFLRNVAVHSGGDGFLVRPSDMAPVPAAEAIKAGMPSSGDPTVLMPSHPCEENVFYQNDGSFAELGSAFACEAAAGNQFLQNFAAYSNCGFRVRFARKTEIRGNIVVGNRQTGLLVDDGWANAIESNTFVRDYGAPIAMVFSSAAGGGRNGDIRIDDNGFVGYARCLRFVNSAPATVQGNRFYGLDSANPDDIGEATGPSPLYINNTGERHQGPDLALSVGNLAQLPGLLDPLGSVSVAIYAPKAAEGIVQGSLTGRFRGEEFEIGRVQGDPPAQVAFPPRVAPFVRVVGASSFIAHLGDVSLARHRSTDASSGTESADNATSGDWNAPGKSWRPNDQPGQWWQVDLGRRVSLGGFAIEASVLDPDAFWPRFHIDVSDTGAFAGEERTVGTETDWPSRPGPVRIYRIPPVRARFVRIVGDTAKADVQMQQFAVYAAPA